MDSLPPKPLSLSSTSTSTPANAIAAPPTPSPQIIPTATSIHTHAPAPAPAPASTSIPSTSRTPLCAICSLQPSRYTCPRCNLKTCSALCSRTHKTTTGCNGERDKVKFVPVNQYGYGKMMDDYVYLEEGRRKVEAWGGAAKAFEGGSGGGQSGGQGNKGRAGQGGGVTRTEALKEELKRRDIHVIFLPEGMMKRKSNQSSWNPKTKSLHISVEFIPRATEFDSENAPKTTTTAKTASTSSILLPRVPIQEHTKPSTQTLASIFNQQILSNSKRASSLPASFIRTNTDADADTDADAAINDLIFVMPFTQHPELPSPPLPSSSSTKTNSPNTKLYHYPSLSHRDQTLEESLKGKGFVEYPTIEVWQKKDWEGKVQSGEVGIVGFPPKVKAKKVEENVRREDGEGQMAMAMAMAMAMETENINEELATVDPMKGSKDMDVDPDSQHQHQQKQLELGEEQPVPTISIKRPRESRTDETDNAQVQVHDGSENQQDTQDVRVKRAKVDDDDATKVKEQAKVAEEAKVEQASPNVEAVTKAEQPTNDEEATKTERGTQIEVEVNVDNQADVNGQ